MTTTTPGTEPPMTCSEPFIHNMSSAPAFCWFDGLWIVLAHAKDKGANR